MSTRLSSGIVGAGIGMAGAGELLQSIVDRGILDLVCVWGDMGDALEALGDLFEGIGGL